MNDKGTKKSMVLDFDINQQPGYHEENSGTMTNPGNKKQGEWIHYAQLVSSLLVLFTLFFFARTIADNLIMLGDGEASLLDVGREILNSSWTYFVAAALIISNLFFDHIEKLFAN